MYPLEKVHTVEKLCFPANALENVYAYTDNGVSKILLSFKKRICIYAFPSHILAFNYALKALPANYLNRNMLVNRICIYGFSDTKDSQDRFSYFLKSVYAYMDCGDVAEKDGQHNRKRICIYGETIENQVRHIGLLRVATKMRPSLAFENVYAYTDFRDTAQAGQLNKKRICIYVKKNLMPVANTVQLRTETILRSSKAFKNVYAYTLLDSVQFFQQQAQQRICIYASALQISAHPSSSRTLKNVYAYTFSGELKSSASYAQKRICIYGPLNRFSSISFLLSSLFSITFEADKFENVYAYTFFATAPKSQGSSQKRICIYVFAHHNVLEERYNLQKESVYAYTDQHENIVCRSRGDFRICIYVFDHFGESFTKEANPSKNVYAYTEMVQAHNPLRLKKRICIYAFGLLSQTLNWALTSHNHTDLKLESKNVYAYTFLPNLRPTIQKRICIYVFDPPDPKYRHRLMAKAPTRSGLCRFRALKNHPPPTRPTSVYARQNPANGWVLSFLNNGKNRALAMNAAKDISQEICSHTDLLDLDQNQGYTAISNNTMFHLLSNTKIASALKLWLFIRFKQSGFKDRRTYTVTIRDLSEHLGVGKSTVQNWQRILVSEGYLEIRARKTSLRSNLANQYRACLPRKIQEELKGEEPQRGSTTHAKKSTTGQKEIGKNRSEGDKVTPTRKVYVCSRGDPIVSDSKFGPNTKKPVQKTEHKNIKPHIIRTLTDVRTPRWLLFLCQGLTMSLNEEGTLCLFNVPDHAKQPLTDFFNDNKALLIAGNRSMNGSLELLSTNSSEASPLPQASKRTNTRPTPTPTPTPEPVATPNILTSNRSKQQVTQHTRQRIYRRLHNLKHHGRRLFAEQQLNRLVAEVIFSVTEGAFSSVATTKAINICLKLIIENRWTTPYQFAGGSLNT